MKVKHYRQGSVCFVAVLNSSDSALPQAVLNATATVSDRHCMYITVNGDNLFLWGRANSDIV